MYFFTSYRIYKVEITFHHIITIILNYSTAKLNNNKVYITKIPPFSSSRHINPSISSMNLHAATQATSSIRTQETTVWKYKNKIYSPSKPMVKCTNELTSELFTTARLPRYKVCYFLDTDDAITILLHSNHSSVSI